MLLDSSFFERNTILVAQDLLGKFLVRKIGNTTLSGMIVETEAYVGPHDLACHASKGCTERTEVMFKEAGTWYVYMIYGMYYCLNIVTEKKNYPSAVLIRALEPTDGLNIMAKNRNSPSLKLQVTSYPPEAGPPLASRLQVANGPGKLCQALGIDKKFNASSATASSSKLFVEDRKIKIPENKIVKAPRIGVDYAKEWKNKLLRFYIKGNRYVSTRHKA